MEYIVVENLSSMILTELEDKLQLFNKQDCRASVGQNLIAHVSRS